MVLVSVPVFVQAPLVRSWPWLSLAATLGWVLLGYRLYRSAAYRVWGDLLLGFAWTWLAGSIYWGWLRWEPLLHLPVEAIGVPAVLWSLSRGWGSVGGWFYIGSLGGTCLTDLYFYQVDLIPAWRQLMAAPPEQALEILQSALGTMGSPAGWGWALGLVSLLLAVGLLALRSPRVYHWALGGAVLSTLLVDGLFWCSAALV